MDENVTFNKRTLMGFMIAQIERKKELGYERTCETYASTLRSFMRFRKNKDIRLCDINADLMQLYEAYLINSCHLARNSTSFYMRILRAVYNKAVDAGIIKQRSPFKYVYTGVEKTAKRGLPLKTIKKIKKVRLRPLRSMMFARDMFMFSFYTRGMSFVDMAYLKKSNLKKDVLIYRRRKTGQQLFVKWEKCMQEIVDRYPTGDSEYLLPIILSSEKDSRLQYRSAMSNINGKLKQLGEELHLPISLTMYVARHSWASAAKSKNIPLAVISEAMGHDNESTTQIYLSSLETTVVDKANRRIISALE
ncbi:MAG: site-specific integrase [Bacteroidaceae bacterium]|nr:site-specific integrase [Bacteroidaceae bacterium]